MSFICCLLGWLIKHKFLLTNFYSSDFGLSMALRGLTDTFVAYFMYSQKLWHCEEQVGREGMDVPAELVFQENSLRSMWQGPAMLF